VLGMKLGKKTWLSIILFSLCGQIAWTIENMLFNVFIQEEFNATLNDIALMVSLSAVAATVTTLLMGALSDRVGKRKIFICMGYLLWGLSIMGFALLKVNTISNIFGTAVNALALGVGLTIAFDCVMTFFGSTANDAAFNAWMTDISDDSNRGRIEGINSAMPLMAVLVVFGGNMLISSSDNHWTILFLTIGIIVLAVGIIGFFTIKDKEMEAKKDESYFKNIFYGLRPKVIKENKRLYIILLGFMIFCTSVQVFMPYLILYFQNTIHLENYVLVFAPAIIVAAVFTFFYGRFIDKYGFTKMVIISMALYLVGLVLLIIFSNVALVFIGTMLMMSGYLSATACFNAAIRNHTPKEQVGLFQGIRIIVQVLIPMLIGPWIGSLLSGNSSEGFLGVAGDSYTPSSLVFLGALVVGIFVYLIVYLFSRGNKKENVELSTKD